VQLTNPYRQQLRAIGGWLLTLWDSQQSSITSAWNVEHKADNTHGEVHADSLQAVGEGTFGGNVTGQLTNIGKQSTPDGIGDGILLGTQWRVIEATEETPGAGTGKELQFWDVLNGGDAPAFRAVWVSDHWVLLHGQSQSSGLHLGTSSRRLDELHVLTANVISTLNSTTGLKGFGRSVADGVGIAVPYSAGNFTASSGTWTVDSGEQAVRYAMNGTTMTLWWQITGTDVSATPTELRMTLPAGFTVAQTARNPITVSDAGAGGSIGVAVAINGDTFVRFFRDAASTAWSTTASDNTAVYGQIAIEVQ
jgi:hypothetical protein